MTFVLPLPRTLDRRTSIVYISDETQPGPDGTSHSAVTGRSELPPAPGGPVNSPVPVRPSAEGVSAPSPEACKAAARRVRTLLRAADYAGIAALLADPAAAAAVRLAVRHEVPRWERILIWRAEGAEGRRERRRDRHARAEAAKQCEVELRTAPSPDVFDGHWRDGSGDYVHEPISTEDHMDGRTPVDVKPAAQPNEPWQGHK